LEKGNVVYAKEICHIWDPRFVESGSIGGVL